MTCENYVFTIIVINLKVHVIHWLMLMLFICLSFYNEKNDMLNFSFIYLFIFHLFILDLNSSIHGFGSSNISFHKGDH